MYVLLLPRDLSCPHFKPQLPNICIFYRPTGLAGSGLHPSRHLTRVLLFVVYCSTSVPKLHSTRAPSASFLSPASVVGYTHKNRYCSFFSSEPYSVRWSAELCKLSSEFGAFWNLKKNLGLFWRNCWINSTRYFQITLQDRTHLAEHKTELPDITCQINFAYQQVWKKN